MNGKLLAGSALVVVALPFTAGVATATPGNDGCPSGFESRTLSEWAADGYTGAPPFVDDPANGGNGDSIVCGRALGEGLPKHHGLDFVVYQFHDNTVPA